MEPGATNVALAVLGPVRAWRGGTELQVGGPQRRAGLALLLAGDGEPVHLDVFFEALWRGDPPASAANVVHRLISALRHALEPSKVAREAGSLIARVPGGYRLATTPETLDLTWFRASVRRARILAVAGEQGRAIDAYAKGLHLWQGPAAAGLDPGVRAHPQIAALDREWAEVARVAADLALSAGRAERVLPVVARAAHAHPLDESLQARHVLLLSASGRRAAALDTYAEVRRRLADELGLDPGEELRAAQREVLIAASAPPPRKRTPAQIPAALPGFTGRAVELAAIGEAAEPGGSMPVIAVSGMAGAGKTALAVQWAHTAADTYPDGQLYADLRGFGPAEPLPPADALRDFLSALGVREPEMPAGLDGRATLFRSLLSGRRVLVLLDNARDAAQVRPLLPGSPGCLALVTSRNPMTALVAAAGARVVRLDPMTAGDARDLLTARIGKARVDGEPTAARELVHACGRLPLALAITAARAAVHRSMRLAELAADVTGHGLDAFTEAGEDLRTVFSWSYRTLPAPSARLFRLLAPHRGAEITVPLAASAAGVTEREARTLLRDLTGAHLLSERQPGRYTMHPLLRLYGAELEPSRDDLVAAVGPPGLVDPGRFGGLGPLG
ncbi:DNA-binding SARP family transcriptional activator [Actinoplanes tereljensis]|uniref:AfsR/SARP family transcriptional regulator n=1 Tax=Paractinoplanes tereljensis TaxID=571912 RepID=UPI0019453128|nr:BTAD domain-containing putative transcriptional regulator [Actinoplanes tereljensis]